MRLLLVVMDEVGGGEEGSARVWAQTQETHCGPHTLTLKALSPTLPITAEAGQGHPGRNPKQRFFNQGC